MDLGDDILNGVVAAIASKCRAIGWNTCKLKSGKILLKVWYDGDKEKSGITQDSKQILPVWTTNNLKIKLKNS